MFSQNGHSESDPGEFFYLLYVCLSQTYLGCVQENINILGYMTGLVVAGIQIHDADTNRLGVLFSVLILDYVLGIGHTWDRNATIGTITNCRLFYVCSVSICLILLYSLFGDL